MLVSVYLKETLQKNRVPLAVLEAAFVFYLSQFLTSADKKMKKPNLNSHTRFSASVKFVNMRFTVYVSVATV